MELKFNTKLALRIVLLTLSILGFCYSFLHDELLFTIAITGFMAVLLAAELYYSLNKANREMSRMINAILNDDFSISYPAEKEKSSFKELFHAFNKIALYFKQMKHQKEAQHEFLIRQFELLNSGLITWNSHNEVVMMNKAAQNILDIPRLSSIKRLGEFIPEIEPILNTLLPKEGKLIQLTSNTATPKTVGLKLNTFIVEEISYYTLIISNLKDEAEQKEIESFQKLISVLTHEVMNTLTPISSLSISLTNIIEKHDCSNDEVQNDIKIGLRTIKKRSETIMNFVENYRKILSTPKPNIEQVAVGEFLEDTIELMRSKADEIGATISLNMPMNFTHTFDPDLLHLVLTNLIKNAIEAFDKQQVEKSIEVKAYAENNFVFIQIIDNGSGISPQMADKIFVPFFTSKEQGSGIGLSFSRQLVKAHGGMLRLIESKSGHTCFEIRL